MSRTDDIIVIIIVFMFVVLPIGWVFVIYPAHPYFIVNGEPVREAAQNAGVKVTHTEDILWPFPGATGGKIYVLEDDAGNTLTIQTQTFESAETRNAVVLTHSAQTTGKARPVGTVLVVGHEVIYISPGKGEILAKIAPEIKKHAATN
jgi:hypothetical protein